METRRLSAWDMGFIVAAVLLGLAVGVFFLGDRSDREISYSSFLERTHDGQIAQVRLDAGTVTGTLKNGRTFRVYVPAGDPAYLKALEAKRVAITVDPPKPWGLVTNSLVWFPLLLLGVWMFSTRHGGGNVDRAMAFGKSPARVRQGQEIRRSVTFADVAGADEAKEELTEIIDFLRNPWKFRSLGARIPRGVLLVGPPGTGKTLLARAVAGEARAAFFSIAGSAFVETFVGIGAARVRNMFEKAKKAAPCLIFIDEIDAVGRQRGAALGGGHDEREQTLNQLLVEMDGFDPNAGVIVLAATNRPDILDPALFRSGRFDRRVIMDAPDVRGRREILDVHMRDKPLRGVDLDAVARRTPGFSGADLANAVNEAALLAARHGKHVITTAEMDEAIDRAIAGPQRKSRVLTSHERRLTAYHEAGHALLGLVLPDADLPQRVTILPRGMALGYVTALPAEDRHTHTRTELLDRIAVALGGRVAEEVVFEEPTTGARHDFERATDLARRMVTEFGMSDALGAVALGAPHGPALLGRGLVEPHAYSDEIAHQVDQEIRRIIVESYERARFAVRAHRGALDAIARALLERETLDAADLRRLLDPGTAPPRAKAPPAL